MRFVWNLEQMDQVAFLVSIDIKILSPALQYQIMKKNVWNQTSKRFVWNLEQMGKVIKPFCWHQNFIPWGLSAVSRGCIHVLNDEKKCIKSDFKDIFLKLATNEWSDKTLLLTSKLCSRGVGGGLSSPALGLYTGIKSWKKLYKIRLQRDFFLNLLQMTKVTRCSGWHQNFVPKGLSAPALGLYTCIKSWKKLYKIRL